MIERTINAKKETVYLTLLDMNKAFDSIQRKTLLKFLQNTISTDELHIIKKMLDVTIAVRCGNTIGETFITDTAQVQTSSLIILQSHSGSLPTPYTTITTVNRTSSTMRSNKNIYHIYQIKI